MCVRVGDSKLEKLISCSVWCKDDLCLHVY